MAKESGGVVRGQWGLSKRKYWNEVTNSFFFLRFNFESNLVNLNNFINDFDKRIRRVTVILVTQV